MSTTPSPDSNCVLVTGGAGFVGSALCGSLLGRGCSVICLDNLSTGTEKAIADFRGNSQFTFIHGDVTEPLRLETRVDAVYHLACPASPRYYLLHPVETLKTCVVGTLNVLDFARAHAVPVVHASTSEVYGNPTEHPQGEHYFGNVNPIGPRSCYDEGKRAAEALCHDYRKLYEMDVRVARLFNTYGPRMDPADGRVVPTLVHQALQGQPLTVFGDGRQTRSFCYIDDMVEGLTALMDSPVSLGHPINLGNPVETSVIDLAHMILRLTESTSDVHFCELPQDDPVRRCPDISRAREVLGWRPTTSLQDGLQAVIDYAVGSLTNEGAVAMGFLEE